MADAPSPLTTRLELHYSAQNGDGSSHQLGNTSTSTYESIDATGIRFEKDSNGWVLINEDGIRFTTDHDVDPPIGSNPPMAVYYPASIEDPNGNLMTLSSSGWTDTLGRFIPATSTNSNGGRIDQLSVGVSTTNVTSCPSGATSARNWILPGPAGGQQTIKLCYANITVFSNFDKPGIQDAGATALVMTAVLLPNGTEWRFQYDGRGALVQITLPTGGTIVYTWVYQGFCGGQQAVVPTLSTRTTNANDGTGAHTWHYSWTPNQTGNVGISTDPLGNDVVHTNTAEGGICSFYETTQQRYQGSHTSGTILKTIATQYKSGGASPLPPSTDVGFDVVPVQITTTLQNGYTSQVTKTYDATGNTFYDAGNFAFPSSTKYPLLYGKVVTNQEYDYATGAPASDDLDPIRGSDQLDISDVQPLQPSVFGSDC